MCVRESVCGNRGSVPLPAPRVSPVLYYRRERKNVKERERERVCGNRASVPPTRECVVFVCEGERVCVGGNRGSVSFLAPRGLRCV